jgi:hypothetical protein
MDLKKISLYLGIAVSLIFVIRLFKKSPEQLKTELDNLPIEDSHLTMSDYAALSYANRLFMAMNRLGTDENEIFEIFENIHSQSDYNLVKQKFGIKPYDGWALADTFMAKKFFSTEKNLYGWLSAELSVLKLRKLKDIVKPYNVVL